MTQEDAPKQASPILYPTGHLNHLSPQQEQALEAFGELCADDGCYTPVRNGYQTSHDDETLLRFLRARKFVPQEALKQFKTTEDWRKEQDLDNCYDNIDVDEYEATSQLVRLSQTTLYNAYLSCSTLTGQAVETSKASQSAFSTSATSVPRNSPPWTRQSRSLALLLARLFLSPCFPSSPL